MADPAARPERGAPGYKFPKDDSALLAWADVEQQLAEARFYWLATTSPDATPHVRPVWGTWTDGCFYFDGHPRSRWARNIAREPRASVHLESAAHVVIVDGVAEDVERTDAELGARIAATWQEKYGRLAPDPATRGIFRLTPTRVRAWSENLTDATVWELRG